MSIASPAAAAGVHVRLQTPDTTLEPDEEFEVQLYVFEADASFNAFDASIRFDPTRVSYVTSSNQPGELMTDACPLNFHIFVPAPDSLRITLVMLCAGASVTGPGEIYRVRFRAGTTPGMTTLAIGPSTQFFNAGFFVNPLEKQDLDICISTCATDVDGGDRALPRFGMAAPRPAPWSGAGPATFDFDLPAAGKVELTLHDLGGRVVARRSAWFQAGRHSIALDRPEVSAGVYYARMHSIHGSVSRPIVLIH
jgi:hypothetical protein